MITKYDLRANLVTDAQVAAPVIEYGLAVCAADRRLTPIAVLSGTDKQVYCFRDA